LKKTIDRDINTYAETVESFAQHLEAYMATLTEREQAIFACLIESAMHPLERMRLRSSTDFLSASEQTVLKELLEKNKHQE